MVLLCKQKALYVKGCVIANGITDSQGDTLYTEDIKKIFTSFNNQDNFEVYHNDIPLQEVSLLENYISTADETIGTNIVPSGSWNCVIRIDNPDIQTGLLNGEFGGLSLNNRIAPRCQGNLQGQVKYEDVGDAECIIPLLISFVERGANGYGLHVMDYEAYIKKSDSDKTNGAKKMAFNLLEGLKSLIQQAEASEEEEAIVEKEEETEEEAAEETPAEKAEVEKAEEEEPAEIEKADDETEEEEEAEITKEDEEGEPDLEARVAALEETVAKLLGENEEESTPEEEVEEEAAVDEDTPKITKSEKVIVEHNAVETTNYYEMTGRDPLTGTKIRNQSKILK